MKNTREMQILLKHKHLKCDIAHTMCSDTQLHSYMYVHVFIYLFIYLLMYLFMYLYIYLFIYLCATHMNYKQNLKKKKR